ncbi:homeodomain-interacting protein kinase 3-like [Pleuronectes platessa]|uniref:homeodomain-interacting protein kinase 3-like n=1 Tax=Pleuronectes platessa TaxID=8262 RepID=UPI00232A086B|nr:homeodomain-interacting protein kinase 3-like [Pleuronectes platessa]XP_053274078.1 homeodomain-interacting protein kinase 3-like [Pleuronectes platessa]XP_053274086.1 homeodomain-interacting protein kinase 3-like [Pleuronectes platessa]
MSQNSEFHISEGDLIPSPTTYYLAQKYLGNGSYGMVIQCRNVTTGETVALKIIQSLENIDCAQEEEVILQNMKKLHSDRFNIVNLHESFFYKEHYCLVFELLDMDLQKFRQISPGQHLQLKQIRPILQQLATALDFMNSAGIIHADLKPDNIMLVDHVRQPLKVKVIDFGISCDDPEEMIGETLQTLWYRSPEILCEDRFSGNIDVWSLGCIAAELSMGTPLFPAKDEKDLGNHPVWTEDDQAEYCDLQGFMDLMKQMLMMSQYDRITPNRILQHPFITMSHLQGSFKNSLYLKSCEDLMDICQDQSSEDEGPGEQVILQMSLNRESSSSTASPAKEASKVNVKSGNRPEVSKVRRCEQLAAARKGTSGKTGPNQSKRMRERHDPSSIFNPSRKKRHMGPAGMRDSKAKVRRSERLAAIRKVASGQTGPIRLKRMREEDDSVGQNRFVARRRIELAL